MDFFEKFRAGLTAPGSVFFSITPADETDLTTATRGIILAVAGDVEVTGVGMADGEKEVIPALIAGVVHPIRAKRIWATNTTATGIKGTY